MDSTSMIRMGAGVVFCILLFVLIQRRRNRVQ
jgi:hypothetical protein